MSQINSLSKVIVSAENSVIVDGVVKKFNYDNSFAINSVLFDHGLRIIIPDGIVGIDAYAFGGRFDVESVYIGKDVKSIHCAAFSGCENLYALEVSPENEELHSVNNCIIRTNKKRLIIGCRTSEIPADGSVIQIWSAFYECKGLKEMVIPEGVTCLGAEAFHGCENLKKVYLPKSLKLIGIDAFYGCVQTNAFGALEPPVEIYYAGTSDDWFEIDGVWLVEAYMIHCNDKTI